MYIYLKTSLEFSLVLTFFELSNSLQNGNCSQNEIKDTMIPTKLLSVFSYTLGVQLITKFSYFLKRNISNATSCYLETSRSLWLYIFLLSGEIKTQNSECFLVLYFVFGLYNRARKKMIDLFYCPKKYLTPFLNCKQSIFKYYG